MDRDQRGWLPGFTKEELEDYARNYVAAEDDSARASTQGGSSQYSQEGQGPLAPGLNPTYYPDASRPTGRSRPGTVSCNDGPPLLSSQSITQAERRQVIDDWLRVKWALREEAVTTEVASRYSDTVDGVDKTKATVRTRKATFFGQASELANLRVPGRISATREQELERLERDVNLPTVSSSADGSKWQFNILKKSFESSGKTEHGAFLIECIERLDTERSGPPGDMAASNWRISIVNHAERMKAQNPEATVEEVVRTYE